MKNVTKDLKVNSIATKLELGSEPVVKTSAPKPKTKFESAMFPRKPLFNGVYYYAKDSVNYSEFHNFGSRGYGGIVIQKNENNSVLVTNTHNEKSIWLNHNVIGFCVNKEGDNHELLIHKSICANGLMQYQLEEVFSVSLQNMYQDYFKNLYAGTEPVQTVSSSSEPKKETGKKKKYFHKKRKFRGNKNWMPRPIEEQMTFNQKKDFLESNVKQLKTITPDDYTCLGCITKNEIDFETATDKAIKVNGTFFPKSVCAFVKHKKGVKFFLATWFFEQEQEKLSIHFKNCL